MSLNKMTALALRVGIVAGMVLMAFGLVLEMTGHGDRILYLGILVLIASPFVGAIVTFLCLLKEGDRYWAVIAGILLLITTAGILVSI